MGYVVADIATAAKGFSNSLGASWDGRIFEDPLQKAKVSFLSTSESDPSIELVEPAADLSPVRRFLNERGGGLHHFCYEVDNVEQQMAAMRARGAVIASRPKPAVAFEGRHIAWVITPERLLVELLARTRPAEIVSNELHT